MNTADNTGYLAQQKARIAAMYNKPEGDNLEKGGPGSKGGKVIGTTESGKPVYEHAHKSYDHFTSEDHRSAADVHNRAGNHEAAEAHENIAQNLDHHKKATIADFNKK